MLPYLHTPILGILIPVRRHSLIQFEPFRTFHNFLRGVWRGKNRREKRDENYYYNMFHLLLLIWPLKKPRMNETRRQRGRLFKKGEVFSLFIIKMGGQGRHVVSRFLSIWMTHRFNTNSVNKTRLLGGRRVDMVRMQEESVVFSEIGNVQNKLFWGFNNLVIGEDQIQFIFRSSGLKRDANRIKAIFSAARPFWTRYSSNTIMHSTGQKGINFGCFQWKTPNFEIVS